MTYEKLRVLIVDDGIHARRGLRTLIEARDDCVVAGEAANVAEGIQNVRDLKPNLVFLDVEMPGGSGFALVRGIGPEAMPHTVFVTAYDRYAVAAFEANAVDYLLKPFTDERFDAALARVHKVRGAVGDTGFVETLRRLLGDATDDRFAVRTAQGLRVFSAAEIDWIEADDYYCRVHIGAESHLVRVSLREFGDRLPAKQFPRIHRSTIVNIDRIRLIEPLEPGDWNVVLMDGTSLRMSRRRREALAGLLNALS